MAAVPPPSDFDWYAGALSCALGLIGRLMFLAQERRSPFTLSLLWELPIAIGMGLLGRGIGDYIGLTGFPLFSSSIVFGFLGPGVISWAIARYAASISPK